MTTFVGMGETEDSPDLLDTLVWALWDLFRSTRGTWAQGTTNG
ncbi:hypothetical protein RKE29_06745 [Streptomyces sp. B1866]|nr:hypothetical protein [Streptomyces sp. B1866]MDT3396340.1 hypothetical protein [Streptomyces sp. B1866]